MLAIAELRSAAADFRQFSNKADDPLAVVVIKIVPAHRPIEHHAPVAATRNQEPNSSRRIPALPSVAAFPWPSAALSDTAEP